MRRAGMDVFAAQVVLGGLRVPDGVAAVGGGEGEVYGLPGFMVMGRERRVEVFGEVFGGGKVLDRGSDVVDRPWEGGLGADVVSGWGGGYGG